MSSQSYIPSQSYTPPEFSLPAEIPAIVLKGRTHARQEMAAHPDRHDMLAASFYRTYWIMTRRIRKGNKDLGERHIEKHADEDFHRPLLYAAIEAAAAICEMARHNPTSPNEETFRVLLTKQPVVTHKDEALDPKVMYEDALGSYRRYKNGNFGKRLFGCLDLSVTNEERPNLEQIKITLRQNLMTSEAV